MSGGQNKRGGRGHNNKGSKNGQKNNGQQNKAGQGKRKSRNRSRSKRVDPSKYWGDTELLEIPDSYVTETPDTSVVATSLGRPPIPGQENASKHYFSLVYDRAAMLAGALAAAGDIQNMAANTAALAEELAARNEEADGDDAEEPDEEDEDQDDQAEEDRDAGDPAASGDEADPDD